MTIAATMTTIMMTTIMMTTIVIFLHMERVLYDGQPYHFDPPELTTLYPSPPPLLSNNKISPKNSNHYGIHRKKGNHIRNDSLNASDSAKADADSYSTMSHHLNLDDPRPPLSDGNMGNRNALPHNDDSNDSSVDAGGEEKWFAYWNVEYNRHYYFNPRTGETTWTMPDNYVEDDSSSLGEDEGGSGGSNNGASEPPSAAALALN